MATAFCMKNITLTAITLFVSFFFASCVTTNSGDDSKAAVKPYPLNTCLVMDSSLDQLGRPKRKVYKGQEMKFCCTRCVKAFNKNPDFYLDKLTKATAPAEATGAEKVTSTATTATGGEFASQ